MSSRYHGLDFARAVLMVLVVFYHASLIFVEDSGWRLSSEQHSYFLKLFSDLLHSFRSAAFYIIAGFFFVMLVEKYGKRKSLTERSIRIGVPMIIIGFTFNFMMNALSEDKAFSFSIEYITGGRWLGHLWFIGNLLFYYLVSIWFSGRFTSENTRPDSMIKIALIALLVSPVISVLATFIGYKIYSGQFLFITFGTLYKYFPFFVLGMYLWAQRKRLFEFMTIRHCAVLVTVSLLFYVLLKTVGPNEMGWNIFVFAESISRAFLAVSSIMLLYAIGNRKSKIISGITNSSYTIFLVHNPLIVCFYVLVFERLQINLYLNFALLCTLVFLVSFAVHYYLIEKYASLKFLLNGKILRTPGKK